MAPGLAGDEMSPCTSGNAEHSDRCHEDEELGKAGSLPYRSFWSWAEGKSETCFGWLERLQASIPRVARGGRGS